MRQHGWAIAALVRLLSVPLGKGGNRSRPEGGSASRALFAAGIVLASVFAGIQVANALFQSCPSEGVLASETNNPSGGCNHGKIAYVSGTNKDTNQGDLVAYSGYNDCYLGGTDPSKRYCGSNSGSIVAYSKRNRGFNYATPGDCGGSLGCGPGVLAVTESNECTWSTYDYCGYNYGTVAAIALSNQGWNSGEVTIAGTNDGFNTGYLAAVSGTNNGFQWSTVSVAGTNNAPMNLGTVPAKGHGGYVTVTGDNNGGQYGFVSAAANNDGTAQGVITVTGAGAGKTECKNSYAEYAYGAPFLGECVAASATGDSTVKEDAYAPYTTGFAVSGTGKAAAPTWHQYGTAVSGTDRATGYNAISPCSGVKLSGAQVWSGTGVCV